MFRDSSAHLQEDTVVYMQHMVLSLSTRVRDGLSVHSLSWFPQGQQYFTHCQLLSPHGRQLILITDNNFKSRVSKLLLWLLRLCCYFRLLLSKASHCFYCDSGKVIPGKYICQKKIIFEINELQRIITVLIRRLYSN
jgi:hypothetical protein